MIITGKDTAAVTMTGIMAADMTKKGMTVVIMKKTAAAEDAAAAAADKSDHALM